MESNALLLKVLAMEGTSWAEGRSFAVIVGFHHECGNSLSSAKGCRAATSAPTWSSSGDQVGWNTSSTMAFGYNAPARPGGHLRGGEGGATFCATTDLVN